LEDLDVDGRIILDCGPWDFHGDEDLSYLRLSFDAV
jgi:hypothetical protein